MHLLFALIAFATSVIIFLYVSVFVTALAYGAFFSNRDEALATITFIGICIFLLYVRY